MESFNTLVLSLPTRNSTLRMRLWRALKEAGSGVLRDGVYVVPAGKAPLAQLESDIKSNGGFAMTLEVKPRTAEQLSDIQKLFDRSGDYEDLMAKIAAAKNTLGRFGARRAQTGIRRLERSLEKLAQIDFFAGAEKTRQVHRLGVRVADLDHAPRRDEAREHPGDLDDALIRPGRRLQPRQPLAARTSTQTQGDGVVELADPRRLGGGDELVQERRTRERPVGEHAERARAGLLVGRPAQDLAERTLDELLIRARVRLERRCDLPVHSVPLPVMRPRSWRARSTPG